MDFENQPETGTSIKDKSENGNNGYRERGLLLVNFKGCGNAAYLYCGDILFHGDTFQAKPYSGKYFMITACLIRVSVLIVTPVLAIALQMLVSCSWLLQFLPTDNVDRVVGIVKNSLAISVRAHLFGGGGGAVLNLPE